ncbi:helix-turn-helix domain-containing protein [Clostridium botulinum]|nr:helix-turn-helix domain-containing protein [Clostridium botulinum]MCS4515504.1 helix-turn-helix domain-containing protein [Clostridium botulinum]
MLGSSRETISRALKELKIKNLYIMKVKNNN